jgi:hypothetical protein
MSTVAMRYPQWQKPLLQAVMEMNLAGLVGKIRSAEIAIFERLRESDRGPDSEEVANLLSAISTLQSMRRVLPETDGQRKTGVKPRGVGFECSPQTSPARNALYGQCEIYRDGC